MAWIIPPSCPTLLFEEKVIRTEVIEKNKIICLDPPTFLFKFVLNAPTAPLTIKIKLPLSPPTPGLTPHARK